VKFENFPNPFQTSTQLSFHLPTNEYVKLEITDALGQVIETLADGQLPSGEQQFLFTPKHLAKGIYFCKLIVGENHLIEKIIYLP